MAAAAGKLKQLRQEIAVDILHPQICENVRVIMKSQTASENVTPNCTGNWSTTEKMLCIKGYARFSSVFITYCK